MSTSSVSSAANEQEKLVINQESFNATSYYESMNVLSDNEDFCLHVRQYCESPTDRYPRRHFLLECYRLDQNNARMCRPPFLVKKRQAIKNVAIDKNGRFIAIVFSNNTLLLLEYIADGSYWRKWSSTTFFPRRWQSKLLEYDILDLHWSSDMDGMLILKNNMSGTKYLQRKDCWFSHWKQVY